MNYLMSGATTLALLSLTLIAAVGCGGGDTASRSSKPRASREPAAPATQSEATDEAQVDASADATADGSSDAPADTATETSSEVASAAPAASSSPATATGEPADAGYGHLKGRFVYSGTAPTPAKVNVTKDIEYCSMNHPLDESLVVNPDNGGLANVVVGLYLGRGDKAPTPHPSYEETGDAELLLDNKFCRFEPHVLFVRTEHRELTIGNSDPVGHNTNAGMLANTPFNDLVPAGGSLTKSFEKAETVPAPVSCSIHPWMKGYLVVKDHPYVAVTDQDGNFIIKNLPVGEWTFQVWHETPGFVSEVNLNGKNTKWSKGRTEFKIENGTLDLGEVKVAANVFE